MVQNKSINLISLHSFSLSCLRPRIHQLDQPFRYFFNSGPIRGLFPFSCDGASETNGDEGAGGSSVMVIPCVVASDKGWNRT